MIGPLSSAAAGLAAASRQLDVAAQNTAHVNTEGYVPRDVSLSEGPGGVQAVVVAPSPAEPAPRVDLASEAVDRLRAKHAYTANLALMKDDSERFEALLDVLG